MVDHEALHGDEPLALCQERALLGLGRHEKRRHDAEHHGNQAFKEENVAPCVDRRRRNSPFGNTTVMVSSCSSRNRREY